MNNENGFLTVERIQYLITSLEKTLDFLNFMRQTDSPYRAGYLLWEKKFNNQKSMLERLLSIKMSEMEGK